MYNRVWAGISPAHTTQHAGPHWAVHRGSLIGIVKSNPEVHLQGTCTPLVHAHAGRTHRFAVERRALCEIERSAPRIRFIGFRTFRLPHPSASETSVSFKIRLCKMQLIFFTHHISTLSQSRINKFINLLI